MAAQIATGPKSITSSARRHGGARGPSTGAISQSSAKRVSGEPFRSWRARFFGEGETALSFEVPRRARRRVKEMGSVVHATSLRGGARAEGMTGTCLSWPPQRGQRSTSRPVTRRKSSAQEVVAAGLETPTGAVETDMGMVSIARAAGRAPSACDPAYRPRWPWGIRGRRWRRCVGGARPRAGTTTAGSVRQAARRRSWVPCRCWAGEARRGSAGAGRGEYA